MSRRDDAMRHGTVTRMCVGERTPAFDAERLVDSVTLLSPSFGDGACLGWPCRRPARRDDRCRTCRKAHRLGRGDLRRAARRRHARAGEAALAVSRRHRDERAPRRCHHAVRGADRLASDLDRSDGPVLGTLDVTHEELAGAIFQGLRLAAVGLAFAVYALQLDHDRLLAGAGWARRSALAVALARRLLPTLERDARISAPRSGTQCRARPRSAPLTTPRKFPRAWTERRRGDGSSRLRTRRGDTRAATAANPRRLRSIRGRGRPHRRGGVMALAVVENLRFAYGPARHPHSTGSR